MTRRQTMPRQWLIVDQRMGDHLWKAARALPRGSGILLLHPFGPSEQRSLRRLAHLRELTVLTEVSGAAARVHNMRQLRQALLRRTPQILISPLYATRSHPEWKPLPLMRAATLARLTGRKAIALGGMNARRYATRARLGFIGWAGISAFRT